MASHCEYDRNNKILLKIKVENKGHTGTEGAGGSLGLSTRSVGGPLGQWQQVLAARAHHTTPHGSWGHKGRPSSGHWAPP